MAAKQTVKKKDDPRLTKLIADLDETRKTILADNDELRKQLDVAVDDAKDWEEAAKVLRARLAMAENTIADLQAQQVEDKKSCSEMAKWRWRTALELRQTRVACAKAENAAREWREASVLAEQVKYNLENDIRRLTHFAAGEYGKRILVTGALVAVTIVIGVLFWIL